MNLLLDASVRFPTVVFTIGLGIVLVYWLFVLLGALDIDLFGADVAGAGKAAGEGLGDAITGGGKGGAEALKGMKPDVHADDGGLWHSLGLAQVPITISLSVIMLLGWIGSLLAVQYARAPLAALGGGFPGVVLVAVLIAAIVVAGVVVRPLRPVFAVKSGKHNRDYVGHTCTITTGSVDEGFGQAQIDDGATVLLIPVRCDRPGALGRGHKALVIDFDPARQAYLVEPAVGLLSAAESDT